MAENKDGGPAFPVHPEARMNDDGMTLRDYFAAKAMGAFVGSYEKGELTSLMSDIASDSYDMADAMLAARKVKS